MSAYDLETFKRLYYSLTEKQRQEFFAFLSSMAAAKPDKSSDV